jgi:rhamnose utilization protein RhaD (predicted bifunctional aldolase and dehydrogenase)/NAD(P)-dependent dehydrogenase (short-subunit alcohol dehydrogenase family)
MENQLSNLVKLSNRFGTKDYAIAGGGNTSYKNKEFIWVKASGTCLGTITEKGFVQLYLSKLDEISAKTYSNDPVVREIEIKQDLDKSIVPSDSNLRPSVETSLHALINYSFVVHTHPSVINGLLGSNNATRTSKELFGDKAIFVEYTDPGYDLCKKVEKLILAYRVKNNCDPKIILLENHGIFVGANTPQEIESIYNEIIATIKTRIKKTLPVGEKNVDVKIGELLPAIKAIISNETTKILKIRNNELINYFMHNPAGFSKIVGPFTPDNIVYCKSTFLFIDFPEKTPAEEYISGFIAKYKEFVKVRKYQPRVIILKGFGIVGVEDTASSAETVLDIFEDMLKISFYSENFGGPHFMSAEQIYFIENWEAENYRRQVSIGAGQGRLNGKIAIVTGGAQGIGEGIVKGLFNEGVNVVIADLKVKEGEMLTKSLNNSGKKNKSHFVYTDVSDYESLQNLVHEAVVNFGGLDIMISNAGILRAGDIEEMSLESFDLMTKINYSAYFIVVKAVVPVLKLQTKYNHGLFTDIIQINSKSGLRGSNKNFAYAGGKFGGLGLTQSFALELMPDRIKVNSICPGNFFEGPLWADPVNGLFSQYLKTGKVPGAKTIDDVKKYYESQVPAKRGCRIEDLMKAIFYVVEQEYETGQAIPVTGGQVMLN